MATLTLILNSKTTLNLMRRDSLSGGPEAPGSVFLLNALPNASSSKKPQPQHNIARISVIQLDRAPPGFQNPRLAATAFVPAQLGEVIKRNCSVFVKWACDADRIKKLARDAEMYSTVLRDLQGLVVPRMYGYYVDRTIKPTFVCLILEYLHGTLPKEYQEYNRECTFLVNRLRDAGVIHNQLDDEARRRHIISSKHGLRVIDFSEARGHERALSERPSSRLARSPHHHPVPYLHQGMHADGRVIPIPGPSTVPSGYQQYLTVPPHNPPIFTGSHM